MRCGVRAQRERAFGVFSAALSQLHGAAAGPSGLCAKPARTLRLTCPPLPACLPAGSLAACRPLQLTAATTLSALIDDWNFSDAQFAGFVAPLLAEATAAMPEVRRLPAATKGHHLTQVPWRVLLRVLLLRACVCCAVRACAAAPALPQAAPALARSGGLCLAGACMLLTRRSRPTLALARCWEASCPRCFRTREGEREREGGVQRRKSQG